MNDTALKAFEDILKNTAEYNKLIDEEKWDELELELNNRQVMLEAFFEQNNKQCDKDILIEMIKKIMALDDIYRNKIQDNRSKSTNTALNFKKKHNAVKAYLEVNG